MRYPIIEFRFKKEKDTDYEEIISKALACSYCIIDIKKTKNQVIYKIKPIF